MLNVLIGNIGAGKSNFISACGGANTFLFNGSKETFSMYLTFEFGSNSYGFVLPRTNNDTFYFKNEWFGYYGDVNYNVCTTKMTSAKKFKGGISSFEKFSKELIQIPRLHLRWVGSFAVAFSCGAKF